MAPSFSPPRSFRSLSQQQLHRLLELLRQWGSGGLEFGSDVTQSELEDLFVDPAHQRRGAATALVAALAARAGEAGATALEVTANAHARGFYLAAGFVDIGVAATAFGDARRMARRLA